MQNTIVQWKRHYDINMKMYTKYSNNTTIHILQIFFYTWQFVELIYLATISFFLYIWHYKVFSFQNSKSVYLLIDCNST